MQSVKDSDCDAYENSFCKCKLHGEDSPFNKNTFCDLVVVRACQCSRGCCAPCTRAATAVPSRVACPFLLLYAQAPPAGTACRCTFEQRSAVDGGSACHEAIVPCRDPSSPFCRNPGANVETCRQGRGTCDPQQGLSESVIIKLSTATVTEKP